MAYRIKQPEKTKNWQSLCKEIRRISGEITFDGHSVKLLFYVLRPPGPNLRDIEGATNWARGGGVIKILYMVFLPLCL